MQMLLMPGLSVTAIATMSVAALLLSCSCDTSGIARNEIEPNDTPAQAQAYDEAAGLSGFLASSSDVDCVSIPLTPGSFLRADLFPDHGDACAQSRVEIFDTDGVSVLAEGDDAQRGGCNAPATTALHESTFVCVSGRESFGYALVLAHSTCGDGRAEPGEACDGADLGNQECGTRPGFFQGELGCNADCTFDTSACRPSSCGDGVVDFTNEQCDGALSSEDAAFLCLQAGFKRGAARCTGDCALDISPCVPFACGDDEIDPGERCDGAALGSQTCQNTTGTGGTLRCRADCGALDFNGCGRLCGDGALDLNEECDDGNNVDGDGCSTACGLEEPPVLELEPNDDGSPEVGGSGLEGNDFSSANAEVISSGATVEGSLQPAGDEDVLAVPNNGATSISVRAHVAVPRFGHCDTSIVVTIRDAAGAPLARQDDIAVHPCGDVTFDVAPGETRYVHVTAFGDEVAVPAYQLGIDIH